MGPKTYIQCILTQVGLRDMGIKGVVYISRNQQRGWVFHMITIDYGKDAC